MSTNKTAARIINRNAAKAEARYNELRADAEAQLKRIMGGLEGHGAGERLNYGHVGDLAYLVEQLTAAADFINGTQDEE